VVRANIAAAVAGSGVDGAVLNVAGGDPKTVNQVLKAVSDSVGRWIEPVRTPKRAGDVRRTHADISRTQKLLEWKPRAGWEDGVGRTVRWFLDRKA
jgi:nucleoside-diphosphate-sugar epimerase